MKAPFWLVCLSCIFGLACFLYTIIEMDSISEPIAPFENGNQYETFSIETVDILVPRFPREMLLLSGELIEGTIYIKAKDGNVMLEKVETGCGCTVIEPSPDVNAEDRSNILPLSFSVNTFGRVGEQAFGLMFHFRDASGLSLKVPARLAFHLEHSLSLTTPISPIIVDSAKTSFEQTLEVTSRVPHLDWSKVVLAVSGSDARATLLSVNSHEGRSVARLRVSGEVPESANHPALISFHSPQLKDQPVITIPFQFKDKHLAWKPDLLEFDTKRPPPRLIVQTSESVDLEDLQLNCHSQPITYTARQTGRIVIFEFQWSKTADAVEFLANDSLSMEGTIELFHDTKVVANIPFRWSRNP